MSIVCLKVCSPNKLFKGVPEADSEEAASDEGEMISPSLIEMCRTTGIRPQIDVELPLTEAREGFERMLEGRTNGKIVFTL